METPLTSGELPNYCGLMELLFVLFLILLLVVMPCSICFIATKSFVICHCSHWGHTQSGLVTCGGGATDKSCYTLTDGVWTKSHTLRHSRSSHSSWTSPLGIVLMGGYDSGYRTELLTDYGQSTELFQMQLQYDTK